jgi:hypothetical protein
MSLLGARSLQTRLSREDPAKPNVFFEPEALGVMGRAYDLALLKITMRNGNTPFVREEIAKAIIAAAADGERRLLKLVEAGLEATASSPIRRRASGTPDEDARKAECVIGGLLGIPP